MKTITIKSKTNNIFEYIINLDSDNKVSSIENRWDVSDVPAWVGLSFHLSTLESWIKVRRPEFYISM